MLIVGWMTATKSTAPARQRVSPPMRDGLQWAKHAKLLDVP